MEISHRKSYICFFVSTSVARSFQERPKVAAGDFSSLLKQFCAGRAVAGRLRSGVCIVVWRHSCCPGGHPAPTSHSWRFHSVHSLQIITDKSDVFCKCNWEDCRLTGAAGWPLLERRERKQSKTQAGGWRSKSKCPKFFVPPLGVFLTSLQGDSHKYPAAAREPG